MTVPFEKNKNICTHSTFFLPKCEFLSSKNLMHVTLTVKMPQGKQNSLNRGEAVRIAINLFARGGRERKALASTAWAVQQRNLHQVKNNPQCLVLNWKLLVKWQCGRSNALSPPEFYCLNGDIYLEYWNAAQTTWLMALQVEMNSSPGDTKSLQNMIRHQLNNCRI